MNERWADSVDVRLASMERKQDQALELIVQVRLEVARLKIRAGFWGGAGAAVLVLAFKLSGV